VTDDVAAVRPVHLVVASQPADRDRLAELLPPHAAAHPLDPRSLAEFAPLVDACAAVVLLDGSEGAKAVRALAPLSQLRAGSALLLIARDAEALLEDALAQLAPREVAPHDAPIALLRHLAARLSDRRAGTGAVTGQRSAEALLGVSRAIRDVLARIELVAPSRLPILILGETGTGKELVARAIHRRSERAAGPFVAINCGGVPESLLESELFGAERGAYTGADRSRRGLFEAADGGTLFLDEIGEMPLAFQVKLLRVLETQEFRRVGATRTQRADVRVVAATHRDLERAAKRGEFRQDLFFRVNGAMLYVPPLRRRRVDIPFLAQHFAEQFGEQNTRQITLAPDFLDRLAGQDFPGNVRELRNAVERAIALSQPGAPISGSALDAATPASTDEDPPEHERPRTRADTRTLREQIAALEDAAIRAALARADGNRTRAARELGLSRLGLRQKMARLGIAVTDRGEDR
jgi:transcriptional regulator with GAF, ATPase, and Fis domain